MDNLLNALEIVNKEAMIGGYGQGAESKAGDFLKGISQIRTSKTLASSGLLSNEKFIDTPVNDFVKDSR